MSGGGHGGGGFLKVLSAWTDLGGWVSWVAGWGVSRALFLSTLFIAEYLLLGLYIPNLPLFTLGWLAGTAPIWVPCALALAAWKAWIWYIQSLYISGKKPVLLEMRIPREVTKSPRAMELAIAALNIGSGEGTIIYRAWKGQVRAVFSLEMVSFGGEVHFYIWCWDTYRDLVESSIYAQYPEVELVQVEDYATKFQFDTKKYKSFGVEWNLGSYMGGLSSRDFRINAYQPLTYVDFELDKDPKEEFKIDPLSYVLEFLSSIKANEQVWVQIVLRKAGNVGGIINATEQDHEWQHIVEEEVERVRARSGNIPDSALSAEGLDVSEGRRPMAFASWRQQRTIENMERHLAKAPFEVGIRGIYWTTSGLRTPVYTGLRYLWRPFGNPQYGVQLSPGKWHSDFDYPWQDFHGMRNAAASRNVFDAYRRRSYYHSPWILPTNVLTSETLASLWHPVSRTVTAPGLARTPATKSEPPPNLPR